MSTDEVSEHPNVAYVRSLQSDCFAKSVNVGFMMLVCSRPFKETKHERPKVKQGGGGKEGDDERGKVDLRKRVQGVQGAHGWRRACARASAPACHSRTGRGLSLAPLR